MARLRKPKKLKLPKKPKANASAETKRNYLRRVAEIKAENKRRMAAYEKERRDRIALDKKIREVRT